MAMEQSNEEAFLMEQDVFETNANRLIEEMLDMENQTGEDASVLVNEILHGIFFLGKITFKGSFSPERVFIGDEDFFNYMRNLHPQPFRLYSSQLPRRSPFSCVLDMIVKVTGHENEEEIKEKLRELREELKDNDDSKILKSTAVCVSHVRDSKKYYGASMSTHRTPARQILIAASCLSFWHEHVAEAVMSYCPQKKKKNYFDGTIQLPADVRCETFNIQQRRRMPPCLSCKDLFGLQTDEKNNKSPYGNCAEAESLSNLLKNEEGVRNRVQPSSNRRENNKQKAENDVLNHLKQVLRDKAQFKWDCSYYKPESAQLNEAGE